MYVIGHDDIAANSPLTSILSRAPFINKNFGDIVASEKRFSMASARCHKINRRGGPNTLQSSKMFVHYAVVAEGADLGNLETWPRAWLAAGAPAATALALRCEHRFGIQRGHFSRRNPGEPADQCAK